MSKVYTDFDAELGIETIIHDTGDKVSIEKKYDAQPLLELAAAERAHTDGQRWGEMRKVGHIPMAELSKMMRQDGRIDPKRATAWLKANPALVSFNKFLK